MKSTCVIFNPTAKGDKAQRRLRQLEELGRSCTLKPTLAAGEARPLAAEAVRAGFETIVAVGGDGTINEVVNGMGDEPEGFARVRLGVLPIGTVNVFARELGLPFSFQRAWDVICRGRETRIDLPTIDFGSAQGRQRRRFVQLAGCGLDARATELVDWNLKRRLGRFAYLVAGFKALKEKVEPIQITGGGKSCRGRLILLGNGRMYGGPVPVFQQADLRDGLLDVCVFPTVNWFVILRYACAYVAPRFLHQGGEHCFQAESVVLESAGAAPVEVDGEPVGCVPASCSVERNVLRVLIP